MADAKLGFNGSAIEQLNIRKRMKGHIEKDEVLRFSYVLPTRDNVYKGCAVSCIATDNLQTLDVPDNVGKIYTEVDRIFNIDYIAPFIDISHTRSYGEDVSLTLIDLVKPLVDYRGFIFSFLQSYCSLFKTDISISDFQEAYAQSNPRIAIGAIENTVFYLPNVGLEQSEENIYSYLLRYMAEWNTRNSISNKGL